MVELAKAADASLRTLSDVDGLVHLQPHSPVPLMAYSFYEMVMNKSIRIAFEDK